MKILVKLGLILSLLGCFALAGCGGSSAPQLTTAELYYDSSSTSTTIGGFGGVALSKVLCCVIFDTAKLSAYVGKQITAVKLFNPESVTIHSYNPVVYETDDGVNPTTPTSKNSTAMAINPQSWKTINLETPVTIHSSKVYWIGFELTTVAASDYPLPVGANSDYHNNKQSTNGITWGTVSYNWIVRILVQ